MAEQLPINVYGSDMGRTLICTLNDDVLNHGAHGVLGDWLEEQGHPHAAFHVWLFNCRFKPFGRDYVKVRNRGWTRGKPNGRKGTSVIPAEVFDLLEREGNLTFADGKVTGYRTANTALAALREAYWKWEAKQKEES